MPIYWLSGDGFEIQIQTSVDQYLLETHAFGLGMECHPAGSRDGVLFQIEIDPFRGQLGLQIQQGLLAAESQALWGG